MLISVKNRRITCTDEISHKNSLSSSVVASNVDLLLQILLCLPVKSLLVFKCVSKQWLYLISDTSFIRNHYLKNCLSTHGHGLIWSQDEVFFLDGRKLVDGIFKKLTFMDNMEGRIHIGQSCNGLLCCFFRSKDYERFDFIYNPSTKHYRMLQQSQFRKDKCLLVCSMSLALDPLKSPYYEAICIWLIEPHKYQIEIYSSETNSWRLSKGVFPAQLLSRDCLPSVFWNGSLHWVNFGLVGHKYAFYFDIGKDLVREMPLPLIPNEYVGMHPRIEYFGEWRGHLHLINTYGLRRTHFDILEMDVDYTGWNIKYHVDLDRLIIANPEIPWGAFNVHLVEEEEDSSKLVLEIIHHRFLISYDLKELSVKKICNLSPFPDDKYFIPSKCNMLQYIETLFCV